MINKKRIFTGTFYPLTIGETLYGRDHYNYKVPLSKHFDIKSFCYNSEENHLVLDKRTDGDLKIPIVRLNEAGNDMLFIDRFFDVWKPGLINFHGGNTGQKGTARKIIEKYKDSGIKFGLEYGGGFNEQTMMQHYYNEDVDYVILNHYLWKDFFPAEYRDRIFITPKNQSVDSNFFVPNDSDKLFDVMTVGRWDGGNKGHNEIYDMFLDSSVDVLLMGSGIPLTPTKNIHIKPPIYNHSAMVDVYNSSKIFVWGTKVAIENPYCIHVRVVAEALSCGLPVVAFANSFVESDLVIHGYSGFLAKNDDEFKEYVNLLLSDKDLYDEISNNARSVAKDADISKFLNFYKLLWESIL